MCVLRMCAVVVLKICSCTWDYLCENVCVKNVCINFSVLFVVVVLTIVVRGAILFAAYHITE